MIAIRFQEGIISLLRSTFQYSSLPVLPRRPVYVGISIREEVRLFHGVARIAILFNACILYYSAKNDKDLTRSIKLHKRVCSGDATYINCTYKWHYRSADIRRGKLGGIYHPFNLLYESTLKLE